MGAIDVYLNRYVQVSAMIVKENNYININFFPFLPLLVKVKTQNIQTAYVN